MRRSVPIVAALVLLSATPATAASEVSIGDSFFSPDTISRRAGGSVHWARSSGSGLSHNVRENHLLFRSGNITSGTIDFTRIFSAGTFHFYCEQHGSPSGGMDGLVKVKPRIAAAPSGLKFTVRWANAQSNTGEVFDVQYRVGSGPWKDWKKNTPAEKGVFGANGKPVGAKDGTKYSFRARSQMAGDDTSASGWSPRTSFTV